MKILHINHSDSFSGAGKAASRIHENLLKNKIDSTMLVRINHKLSKNTLSIGNSRSENIKMSIRELIEFKISNALTIDKNKLFSPSLLNNFKIDNSHMFERYDLVNLYWINGAFISPEQLKYFNKSIVWRLSDVWPFTGGCHYPGSCMNFVKSCGNCPQLRFKSSKDISYKLWKRKKSSWEGLDINVVAPSRWIEKLAKKSNLFCNYKIKMIHTGIDLKIFKPSNKIKIKSKFKLPLDEFLIFFGATDFINDKRKGFNNFCEELKILSENKMSKKITVVFFGNKNKVSLDLPLKSKIFRFIDGENNVAEFLNCADIMVVPSLEDNLPNIALEAMACGVPLIGYNVCGLPDIIKSGWNGELIQPKSKGKIAEAILNIIKNKEKHKSMKYNSLAHAHANFCINKQTKKLIQFYRDIIKNV